MKILFSLLTLVFFSIPAHAGYEPTVTPAPTPEAEAKITLDQNLNGVLSDSIGLKVIFPKEWKSATPIYQNRALFMDYKNPSKIAVSIEPASGKTAQEFLEAILSLNQEHEAEPTAIQRGLRQVSKRPANVLTFSKKTKMGVVRSELTALAVGKDILLFTCSNFEKEFPGTAKACKKVIDQATLSGK